MLSVKSGIRGMNLIEGFCDVVGVCWIAWGKGVILHFGEIGEVGL